MDTFSVPPISNSSGAEASRPLQDSRVATPAANNQTPTDKTRESAEAQNSAAPQKASGSSTQAADREKNHELQMNNVSLQFKIDPKSQELTVIVRDKTSHKVLRTIPAEEMSKFRDGGLMEWFG